MATSTSTRQPKPGCCRSGRAIPASRSKGTTGLMGRRAGFYHRAGAARWAAERLARYCSDHQGSRDSAEQCPEACYGRSPALASATVIAVVSTWAGSQPTFTGACQSSAWMAASIAAAILMLCARRQSRLRCATTRRGAVLAPIVSSELNKAEDGLELGENVIAAETRVRIPLEPPLLVATLSPDSGRP